MGSCLCTYLAWRPAQSRARASGASEATFNFSQHFLVCGALLTGALFLSGLGMTLAKVKPKFSCRTASPKEAFQSRCCTTFHVVAQDLGGAWSRRWQWHQDVVWVQISGDCCNVAEVNTCGNIYFSFNSICKCWAALTAILPVQANVIGREDAFHEPLPCLANLLSTTVICFQFLHLHGQQHCCGL